MSYGTNVTVEKAQKLIDKKSAKVVDVRDPVSYRDGTILEAVNVPLRNISSLVKWDKRVPLIIYGDEENLNAAAKYAVQMGFADIYRIKYRGDE